jgi:hypothetical protein
VHVVVEGELRVHGTGASEIIRPSAPRRIVVAPARTYWRIVNPIGPKAVVAVGTCIARIVWGPPKELSITIDINEFEFWVAEPTSRKAVVIHIAARVIKRVVPDMSIQIRMVDIDAGVHDHDQH